MKIVVLQLDTQWKEPQKNREKINFLLEHEASEADIVVLPEMFSTGFTMKPTEVSETMNGETVAWIKDSARKYNTAIVGSIVISEQGNYYNRLLFATPDGKITKYDKRHLFRMAGEEMVYSMGNERVFIEYKGWRIMPLICYDLRFPVWSRNKNDYDMLIYVASWPSVRSYPWKSLAVARAIENQCYTICCNRVGRDPKNEYSGDSAIYDFKGEPIAMCEPSKECIIKADINIESLKKFRSDFPAYLDADKWTL
ncbi:MAG: amidohydrolase [Rikenellaceae bacterium]